MMADLDDATLPHVVRTPAAAAPPSASPSSAPPAPPLHTHTVPPVAAVPFSQPVRVTLLKSLRVVLHLGVILALTLRSTTIGSALHPYERTLANEWIHLLFYVDTVKEIPSFDPLTPNSTVEVQVTLPNFVLESEEEIAANVDDEFFSGGFAARASSFPVGLLFTIDETRKHLHGVVQNYLTLADVALEKFYIAGECEEIPYPELTVWTSWDGDSTPHKSIITGGNESEWPAPLRLPSTANATETRKFFDQLDGLEMLFLVGMQATSDNSTTSTISRTASSEPSDEEKELFKWWVRITYDLQSQGHLEVSLNFGLKPMRSDAHDENLMGLNKQRIPSIFFDRSTTFDWCLVVLVTIYQSIEVVLKWWDAQTTPIPRGRRRHHHKHWTATQLWRIVQSEACTDFWFWATLTVNIATLACVASAWYHAYRLYLWDGLCLAFASCCALQWISLVRYLSAYNTRFHILGLTLQRGLPRVAQFLAGVLPIFVGYVLFGTIMFGAKVPRFQSAGATSTTLFAIANGDEIHDTFNAVAFTPWIGQLYVYSYLILFSYVVLMVCIGIIEDAFFSAVFPASWPSLYQKETEGKANKKRRTSTQQRDTKTAQ